MTDQPGDTRPAPIEDDLPSRRGGIAAVTHRNFWPYIWGNLLSQSGTWFQNLAQVLFVYQATGSVFLVGVVNFAQFGGVFLVGPYAGVVADRFDRRKVLLATQILSALLTVLLALLSWVGWASVPIVMAVALGLGLAQAFSTPSMLALVTQLVPRTLLGPAVSLNLVTFNVARAIGPVLGAFVVANLGFTVAFALNSLSFVALIAGLLAVRILEEPADPEVATSSRSRTLRDSLRRLRDQPQLITLIVSGACISLAIDPILTLSPEIATEVLGSSDALVGWMVGAFGAGAALAAIVFSRDAGSSDRQLVGLVMLVPVAMTAFAFATTIPLSLAAAAFAGVAYMAGVTGLLTRLQMGLQQHEQGRVLAIWSIAFMGSRPIGALIDGTLATYLGLRPAVIAVALPAVGGAVLLAAMIRRTTARSAESGAA